jgi:hypothetical protein
LHSNEKTYWLYGAKLKKYEIVNVLMVWMKENKKGS